MTLKLPDGTSLEYDDKKGAHDLQRSVRSTNFFWVELSIICCLSQLSFDYQVHRHTSPFAKRLYDVLSRPTDITGSKDMIDTPSCCKVVQDNQNLSFELKPNKEKARELQECVTVFFLSNS